MKPAVFSASKETPELIGRFVELYRSLSYETLHRLDEVYAQDAVFEDPLRRVEGIEALHAYFRKMYHGVVFIHFDIDVMLHAENETLMTWQMHLRHRRLRPGETLLLPGATHLRHSGKVSYHRDYFDVGALLYERLPVIGGVVRALRRLV